MEFALYKFLLLFIIIIQLQMVKSSVGTCKESMKTMKDEPGTQADKLACFLLSYRTTPRTATGCTSAELQMS